MKRQWTLALLAGALVLGSTAFTSCGDDKKIEEPKPQPQPNPNPQPNPQPQPQPEPEKPKVEAGKYTTSNDKITITPASIPGIADLKTLLLGQGFLNMEGGELTGVNIDAGVLTLLGKDGKVVPSGTFTLQEDGTLLLSGRKLGTVTSPKAGEISIAIKLSTGVLPGSGIIPLMRLANAELAKLQQQKTEKEKAGVSTTEVDEKIKAIEDIYTALNNEGKGTDIVISATKA